MAKKSLFTVYLAGNTYRFGPSKRHHNENTIYICYKPDNFNEFSDGDMVRN